MKSFRELKVWEKSHQLVLQIYRATRQYPSDEKFNLISQIRRSALSVVVNIVEGFKRRGNKDFVYFLNMADASLEETKYHLLLSKDLGYLAKSDYHDLNGLCEEIGKMLNGLQSKIKERNCLKT
jgi:four helix bundle protein